MMTPVFLILVGLMSRLLPHPSNAVALGAIALYAGARLSRRWAIVVPLAIMVASDLILNYVNGYTFYPATSITTYVTFALVAGFGGLVPKDAGGVTRAGMSVTASTVFFIVSNFVVWAEGSGLALPKTFAGLIACYSAAVWPFYVNSLLADLVGTASLFGLDALFSRDRAATQVAPIGELATH